MKHYSILIVEDERQIANILRAYLALYKGFSQIVIASDGVQAMQKISNQDFDLIITDVVMPKRDGLAFIDRIRKIPKYYKQKIMIVSGCLTAEMTYSCMRKGVRHIIVKPFTARQILLKAIVALKVDKHPVQFVDKIIEKVTMRLLEDKDKMEYAIPDEAVAEMIRKSKGEK